MAYYKVRLKPSVHKDLRRLPRAVVRRVLDRLQKLHASPVPRGAIKLSVSEALYRLRVGNYRIIYGVNRRRREVLVHYVRHRRDAYRGL